MRGPGGNCAGTFCVETVLARGVYCVETVLAPVVHSRVLGEDWRGFCKISRGGKLEFR